MGGEDLAVSVEALSGAGAEESCFAAMAASTRLSPAVRFFFTGSCAGGEAKELATLPRLF